MIINKNDKKSIRSAYGKTLVKLGMENKNIIVMDADLACSTQTGLFAKEFPERFFDSGIAEQDMIATAAGLAAVGKIPFVSTFAMFATGRTYDQIRNTVCYPEFNVKIVATHGGITVGEDGASHQALEDVALMRNIPNMQVIVPADCTECAQVIEYAAKHSGPMYIRLARTNVCDIFGADYKFDFNTRTTERLTYQGQMNLSAEPIPGTNSVIMITRHNGYRVARMDEDGSIYMLTTSNLDESPSVAPNGSMVIYSTIYQGRKGLAIVSADGRFRANLPSTSGEISSPAWGPLLD